MGFSLLLDPQNREVGKKLGIATLCMFTLPIITYYIIRTYIMNNLIELNIKKDQIDTYAGGGAILITNIIIGIYCFYAYIEDNIEKEEILNNSKNNNGDEYIKNNDDLYPRVGAFKQRTD